jgi:[acyl-carrier-protein] S-malonyltransferase
LLEPALAPLQAALERASWATPEPRFFSTFSVSFETGGFVELLQRQLVSPVRFTQSVRALFAAGYDSFLEVGPGGVLGGLVRRITPQATVARVSDLESLAALRDNGRYLEDS